MSIKSYDCGWLSYAIAFDKSETIDHRLCVGSYSVEPFTNFVDLVECRPEGEPVARGILPLCDPASKIMFNPAAKSRGVDVFAVTSGDALYLYECAVGPAIVTVDNIMSANALENLGSHARSVVVRTLTEKIGRASAIRAKKAAAGENYMPPLDTHTRKTRTCRPRSDVAPIGGCVATSFDWSRHDPTLAAVSYTSGILAWYDVDKDKEILCAAVHDDTPVFDLCFCDAHTVATVGRDGSLRTVDQRDMSETLVVGEHPQKGSYFNRVQSSELYLACFGENDTDVCIFDRRKPGEAISYCRGGHDRPLNGLVWGNDSIVTVGDDKTCNIWQVEPGKAPDRRLTYEAPHPVYGVDFRRKQSEQSVAITTGNQVQLLRV